jgi:hypothetical protein
MAGGYWSLGHINAFWQDIDLDELDDLENRTFGFGLMP